MAQAIEEKSGALSEGLSSTRLWQNWGRNQYYNHPANPLEVFRPATQAELCTFLQGLDGKKVRVEGQTHSQPPLIVDNATTNTVVIDMTLYRSDDMPNGMKLVDGPAVKVNTGITETALDEFLGSNDLSLITVTAGGFFSIGGMTSIDVHGATHSSGIFANHAIEFEIMGANGNITTITSDQPEINFARVNMGALGVVVSVTIQCMPRNPVTGAVVRQTITDKQSFANFFVPLMSEWARVETFYNPYNGEYAAGCWNVGEPTKAATTNFVQKGAPVVPLEPIVEKGAAVAQYSTPEFAGAMTQVAFLQSDLWLQQAVDKGEELWLNHEIIRAMFMSYFIPIGELNDAGMQTAWDAMNVVTTLNSNFGFNIVAPMEFRFVKGGETALSGAYSATGQWFVNLDLIGYLDRLIPVGIDYKQPLMQFFAEVEKAWFTTFQGLPHHGKMFGFYDPVTNEPSAEPFNPAFLVALKARRPEQVHAFNEYRKSLDGSDTFSNEYILQLVME